MYSILVLEDDRMTRELIRDFMSDEGVHIVEVGTLAALEQQLPTSCDLLLADLHLPDGYSLDVLPAMRAKGLLNVDFLVMTADNRTEVLQNAFIAGAVDYLSKPLILEELHARLEAQFEKKLYQQKLQGVLNALPSGVFLVDSALTIHHANTAGWHMFGRGKQIKDLPKLRELQVWLAERVLDVLAQGGPFFGRWQSPAGSVSALFDVSIQSSPYDSGLVVVAIDDKSELLAQEVASIVGDSEAIERLKQQITRVAKLNWNTLIQGPSGSGKELVARELHRLSDRGRGPFVALNCAAIHEGLLGDLLFGHERGAFTGAQSRHAGVFEQAESGTLFLDEIADLPMNMQGSLLRVLQEKTVTRLGGSHAIAVDARIVFATHKVLADCVRKGQFREDLFYRVNAVGIAVPPLRARGSDAALLLKRALLVCAREIDEPVKTLSKAAEQWACAQSWPGNVRQLEHVARRLALHQGQHLDIDACEAAYQALFAGEPSPWLAEPVFNSSGPEPDEPDRIREALLQCKGNKTAAAKYLGVGRATLYRKLLQYKL